MRKLRRLLGLRICLASRLKAWLKLGIGIPKTGTQLRVCVCVCVFHLMAPFLLGVLGGFTAPMAHAPPSGCIHVALLDKVRDGEENHDGALQKN